MEKIGNLIYDRESYAYSWINKLECFFQMRDILEEEKIQAAMVALDGKALSWFQWWETCNSDIGWGDFKVVILERFQTSATLNPFVALLALKQEETMEECVKQFERFVGVLYNVGEAMTLVLPHMFIYLSSIYFIIFV